MDRLFQRWIVFGAGLLLGAGCATSNQRPSDLALKAKSVLETPDPIIFWVPSKGMLADAAFRAGAQTGPTSISQDLADLFSRAATREVKVAVSGANSAKVRQVIQDAADLQVAGTPQLHLLYVGDQRHMEAIEETILELGATFHYAKP